VGLVSCDIVVEEGRGKGDIRPYRPPNKNRIWLKLTKISRSKFGVFSIVCGKCYFCDVSVGGASVVSTSGFLFPVEYDLNRSTGSGKFSND